MNELPAGLPDPLHILDPFPLQALVLWLAALLFAALAFLWWRHRRGRASALDPEPKPSAPPRPSTIGKTIDDIRSRYNNADRRHGCHELARALRGHYEKIEPHRFSTLTVREIATAIGDRPLARFFALLAELQFGRREPSHSDFSGACELAHDVVKGRA